MPTPTVIQYCGHMMQGIGSTPGLRPSDLPALELAIQSALEAEHVRHAFGALACGADILIAERVVKLGATLHVILPFPAPRFVQTSVAPAAGDWVARFDGLLRRATSCVTLCEHPGEDLDPHYQAAALQSMTAALALAREHSARVLQVAIWDGQPGTGPSGTAASVAHWRSLGRPAHIIPPSERVQS